MNQAKDLKNNFYSMYGADPSVFRAPGRVNLIGEHTDYNDGFVMPAAIEFYTWVAISPRTDRKLVIRSENFQETQEFDLDEMSPLPRNDWSDYVRGVAVVLQEAGRSLCGANMLIRGEVPIGAGLSSSAAIEVACGYALLENSGSRVDRVELAKLCRLAENTFVGMRCGIMDQFISCCGQAGQSLMLDCRSLEYHLLPLPENVHLVISNTKVKHEHASGEYNTRRQECESAVRILSRWYPDIHALRDVTLNQLEAHSGQLPDILYKRARHVTSENQRVEDAARALDRGDLEAFGDLMNASHRSLRNDYAVSCAELDVMVDQAMKLEGVYGARMTGGGFGGCTISLVMTDKVEEFKEKLSEAYEKATGYHPDVYICAAASGAGPVLQ